MDTERLRPIVVDLHGGRHRSPVNCCLISMEVNRYSISNVVRSPWRWAQVNYVNCCLISIEVDTVCLFQLLFDVPRLRHIVYSNCYFDLHGGGEVFYINYC